LPANKEACQGEHIPGHTDLRGDIIIRGQARSYVPVTARLHPKLSC